ncbi:MAG: HsdR family type I site-specific deoxyribonuclease [Candidatus Cloacimonetes bacterium]|nr:HsdR family type I site-specific deoxyribonuclease [Candidatus Cloacimonadota bacterium]MDD3562145.1 HsdR family type I site-specific deoxyribonuclease [Candidatus Cloacimonadota bacterium]MDD4277312.1 HsdR family type I site-specific deoxyribonuclease [Candidatus Cloacimonadota bacterium]
MTDLGQIERKTQSRIVKLFQDDLHYEYLGDWQDREDNQAIEEKYLSAYLSKRGYSADLISKAIYELNKTAYAQNKTLYDINKEVYTLLRYGIQIKPELGENSQTVELIDWHHPEQNHFAIAEEVTVRGVHNKRPDLVIYVNGIALGVLELKRSTVSVAEGIRQNIDSQKPEFIKQFFSTMQFVMAGNDSEGLRFGTIETKEKYYLKWKEKGEIESSLDGHILALCSKERFLELIHDFIVFDSGTKKLCRHNQYNAVRSAQASIKKREGGIIWHTQGSGKSLIMVWLAKWIRENITDSRVLIITDRDELDKQIEKVFKGVSEDIYRTKSGADLIDKLGDTQNWLLCSLIHKFRNKDEGDYQNYIADILSNLPAGFRAKGNFYVFVDECHRSQSGDLHKSLKAILPDAMFIGFTGTPLLRKDKRTTLEVFGKYIDTYKFDEAVRDKAIVDLRYEARDIDQNITSEDKIDQWFEAKTKGLKPLARAELKRRWGTMQRVLSSRTRLEKIVADILLDMELKDRLASGRGNALLVAGSIYEACKYYQLFIEQGFNKCAIVTSYVPDINDIKKQYSGDDDIPDDLLKYEIYQKMLAGKSVEVFEDEAKKRFVEEPGQMKLLIVVDKLLTGFDAPSATYLYIDKFMQDHGLFQAICRVNRIDTEDKEYGYVIDYKDLFFKLDKAVTDYTSGAFDNFEPEDVSGLLEDRLKKAKEHLEEVLETIKALCEPVQPPKTERDYIRYFCGNTDNPQDLEENEQKRLLLYKTTASLVRAYAEIAGEMDEAGFNEQEAQKIAKDVQFYENLRMVIKLASGDYIDLKMYEPAMRHLIDTYIQAEDSVKITAFDNLGLVDLIIQKGVAAIDDLPEGIKNNEEATAETIENNVRKLIIDGMPGNPIYFELMSTLLDEIIKQRKAAAIRYREYLQKIIELTKKVRKPETSERYTAKLDTSAKRALYDNLSQDEELALELDKIIKITKKADWRGDLIKEREVKRSIRSILKDNAEVDRIFELVKNQQEY